MSKPIKTAGTVGGIKVISLGSDDKMSENSAQKGSSVVTSEHPVDCLPAKEKKIKKAKKKMAHERDNGMSDWELVDFPEDVNGRVRAVAAELHSQYGDKIRALEGEQERLQRFINKVHADAFATKMKQNEQESRLREQLAYVTLQYHRLLARSMSKDKDLGDFKEVPLGEPEDEPEVKLKVNPKEKPEEKPDTSLGGSIGGK
ncbi:uncharacterized protein CTRU02_213293 [Colletotrichum truncatum]|uniref:Uncharacterized protein n=1 Tax=Colletotrichum truncatum TaxID=5467 RepID=A0ACC3YK97_COLTU|nr:uncharacterized protein CTRU02_12673 [Colletotrichum truncatum]KAF6784411.1 hypothetical protein CTRU02_12673 [Colletotrichum truncatum]